MATSPSFAATPRIGSVSIPPSGGGGADSSYTAPTAGNVGTVITGASTGTRIAEIVVKCAASSSLAIVRIFLYDGTTYWLFDEVTIAAATGSNTVQQTRVSTSYNNLILPSASWSIRVTTSVSQTTHVTALGADL
jgi:hypothetical protein